MATTKSSINIPDEMVMTKILHIRGRKAMIDKEIAQSSCGTQTSHRL